MREVMCIHFGHPTKSIGGQPWPELELHDWPWECSLERGERRKKRVKEWVSLGARRLLGGGVLLQGGAGCCSVGGSLVRVRKETGTWFPAAREEGNRKKAEKKKGKNEKKKGIFFPNLEISEKIKDTL
jgi:hypothetical protein